MQKKEALTVVQANKNSLSPKDPKHKHSSLKSVTYVHCLLFDTPHTRTLSLWKPSKEAAHSVMIETATRKTAIPSKINLKLRFSSASISCVRMPGACVGDMSCRSCASTRLHTAPVFVTVQKSIHIRNTHKRTRTCAACCSVFFSPITPAAPPDKTSAPRRKGRSSGSMGICAR